MATCLVLADIVVHYTQPEPRLHDEKKFWLQRIHRTSVSGFPTRLVILESLRDLQAPDMICIRLSCRREFIAV